MTIEVNTELKGKQFGVRLVQRASKDEHICIQLLSEDDENWFEVGNSFSAYWLDDLISILQNAKTILEADTLKHRWGYDFSVNREDLCGQPVDDS